MTDRAPSAAEPVRPERSPQPPAGSEAFTARAREHLANERTVLAWTRTAITLMALGFVVARFGIFLRQIASEQQTSTHYAGILGIGLVVAGLIAGGVGVIRFFRVRAQIDAGRYRAEFWPEAVLASLTALIGLALVVYLAVNA